MASRDKNGVNTTSLAKNLSQINNLTDTNNQEILENTKIVLPKIINLNNVKYKIKKDGTVIINNSILPDEYEQVEYIESTGTQYIITDIIPNNSMGIYAKVSTDDAVNNSGIIGANGQGNSRFFVSIKEETASYGWNNFIKTNLSVSPNVIYTIELNYYNSRVGLLNNEVAFTITDNLSSYATRPMYIFAVNWEGTTNGNSITKLYELKLTEEATVKYNFVPCYNINSGVIGLYDTVNGQFYVNQGSGTFKKGNDV